MRKMSRSRFLPGDFTGLVLSIDEPKTPSGNQREVKDEPFFLPSNAVAVIDLLPTAQAAPSIVAVDTAGLVGRYPSLVLDGVGNPVISYHTGWPNYDLAVAHCNDPNCAGGDESIVAVDTAGNPGQWISLVLDGGGNPVISYYDVTNGDLKVAHCNDPNCTGGGESIVAIDTAGDVGMYTSLALDGVGNPVISYYDVTNGDLKVAHCNDPNCVGGGESIVAVDTAGNVGQFTSLVLDGVRQPRHQPL